MNFDGKSEFRFSILKVVLSFCFIILFFWSCSHDQKNYNKLEFVYKRYYDSKIIRFEKRKYNVSKDTIVELVQITDSLMNVLYTDKRTLIKSKNGLDILINGQRLRYLKFNTNTCTRHLHPMGFFIETCFIEKRRYKGYENVIEYHETALVTDGAKEVIYLDSNCSLIDRINTGVAPYDSIIRIEGQSVPM